MRAVHQSMTANPVVMIDEIDKAKESSNNGYLAHALLSFSDVKTASRYRDSSLDAELDLSRVSFIATANDAKLMPDMLRDRFRMIRMPTPTLQPWRLGGAGDVGPHARRRDSRRRAWARSGRAPGSRCASSSRSSRGRSTPATAARPGTDRQAT